MERFRNILVAIAAERSQRGVLARAARLAKQNRAAIRLASVVEELPWHTRLVVPGAEGLQAILVGDRAEKLERLAEELRQSGVEASGTVLRGRPHVELVREVLRGGHDLLLKEAEPNENVLFGSMDMHLLRTCPCPVWVERPGSGERPYTKVLAPVDPAPPPDEADLLHVKADLAAKDPTVDAKILGFADSLSAAEGAELHVLLAWSAPGEELVRGQAMLARDQVERYVEDSRAEAEKGLKGLLAASPDTSGRRSVHLIKGNPADVIAEYAESNGMDLIVMGTVARTGIPGLLIGNTAESVLQRVSCSVLAVKPDGFVSPVTLG